MGLLDKLFGRDTPSQEIVGKVDKEGPRNPIDQLGVTGRSQRNAAYEDTAHIPRITDYVAEKLSQLLRYSTEMPVLRLTEDDSPAQITDSKLGGAFYVPEGMKAPRNLDTGNPLYLLAQLNFSQLPQLDSPPRDCCSSSSTARTPCTERTTTTRSRNARGACATSPTCRSPHCMPTVSSNPPGMTTRCCRSTTPTPSDG